MSADSTSAPDVGPVPTGLCTHAGTPLRSDGLEARNRLLRAALHLFAAKGFAKTSTREISAAAGVNLAAISYYFGDKAGLYRAAYHDPLNCGADGQTAFAEHGLPLRQALALYLQGFTDTLKQGELARQLMQLHFREMLEPTGLWQEHIAQAITPMHAALIAVLQRALALEQADDDLHRLAFCISGLGIQMFVSADVIQSIRPALMADSAAIDHTTHRLTDLALAMVDFERQRRLRGPTP